MVCSIVSGQVFLLVLGLADLFSLPQVRSLTSAAVTQGVICSVALALPGGIVLGLVARLVLNRWERWSAGRFHLSAAAVATVATILTLEGAAVAEFYLFAIEEFHRLPLIALATVLVAAASLAILLIFGGVLRRLFGLLLGWLDRRLPQAGFWMVVLLVAALSVAALYFSEFSDKAKQTVSGRGPLIIWAEALAALFAALLVWRIKIIGRFPWPRAYCGITALAGLLLFTPLAKGAGLYHALVGTDGFLPTARRVLRPMLDFDGDGSASVLGDRDCAAFNGRVSPWGIEIPGNQVDEDCRFGDLVPLQALPEGLRPPPPRRSSRAVQKVVLVSINGLRLTPGGALSRTLPLLAQRMKRAVVFQHPVGVAGPFRQVAPLLLAGRLSPVMHKRDSGFPPGGPTIPGLLERAGGFAFAAAPKEPLGDMTPIFLYSRRKVSASPARMLKFVSRPFFRSRKTTFLWLAFDLARQKPKEIDATIDKLFQELAPHDHRVLLVGLSKDKTFGPGAVHPAVAGGGPMAIFGSGLGSRQVSEVVGLFDIYPTLVDYLGLVAPANKWPPDLKPLIGLSLRSAAEGTPRWLKERPGTLGGWLGTEREMVAVGRAGLVAHDSQRRRFRLARLGITDSKLFNVPVARLHWSTLPETADARKASWAKPLLLLLRERYLARLLLDRNRLVARARHAPPPTTGNPAQFYYSLDAIGCRFKRRADGHMLVTVYLRGGSRLRKDDLLYVRLRSAETGTQWIRTVPLHGAYPLGSWAPGELIAVPVLFDLRHLSRGGTGTVWVSVYRGKKEIALTRGQGVVGNRASLCNYED